MGREPWTLGPGNPEATDVSDTEARVRELRDVGVAPWPSENVLKLMELMDVPIYKNTVKAIETVCCKWADLQSEYISVKLLERIGETQSRDWGLLGDTGKE